MLKYLGLIFNLLIYKGAEASLHLIVWHNREVIMKKRLPKKYRVPELDQKIRIQRTKHESQAIHKAKLVGVPTPLIFMVDVMEAVIVMEYVKGQQVKYAINNLSQENRKKIFNHIGELIGRLHKNGIIHGDLTTSNIILTPDDRIVFIDFGLSEQTRELEAKGVDLHLIKRALNSTHYLYADECFKEIIKSYRKVIGSKVAKDVMKKISEIEKRGRYISER
jgi:TP53 regulating kinase-like protein